MDKDTDDSPRYFIAADRLEHLLALRKFPSPRALAIELNIRPDRIYDAISGVTSKLAVDLLFQIAERLDVDPEFLLGLQDEERRGECLDRPINMVPVVGDIWPGHFLDDAKRDASEKFRIPVVASDYGACDQFAYRVRSDRHTDKISYVICIAPADAQDSQKNRAVMSRRVQTLTEFSIYDLRENGGYRSIFDPEIVFDRDSDEIRTEAFVVATFSQIGAELPLARP